MAGPGVLVPWHVGVVRCGSAPQASARVEQASVAYSDGCGRLIAVRLSLPDGSEWGWCLCMRLAWGLSALTS